MGRTYRLYLWLIARPVRCTTLEQAFVWWLNRRVRRRRRT